ncbi:MAG: NADH-quinone oxidoreductase subunit L [Bacteroidales bacterium]|nr:NADH-quinone oxidoreductase subunit L [Bacteroidales bacterium]MDD4603184.1 NADH-quinone oxidoreductase subunit L [Bacteroidales bacterium]
MIDFSFTALILLIPLFMFVVLGLFGNRFKPLVSGIAGTTGLFVMWVLSLITAYMYFFVLEKAVDGTFQKFLAVNMRWLTLTDKLHIDMGVLLDPISVMMLIVITTVSFMANLYSIGYMKGEKGYMRFFSFLSLFSFSMLGLVVATNIFQMYIFWELVGVSSYLLIGFYYTKDAAVAASKKAFIVTRFADLGFLIGILMLSYLTGTFDFITLTGPDSPAFTSGQGVWFLGLSTMTWSMIFIFMGGAGKSAMFPLHIWLPDAMEGPTPVSALIHAATMVVAGVYLVARLFPIYVSTPVALDVVMYVGAFSSIFAAIIACTQYDIKRVLAYSTMSQIGMMMFALGISGYGGHEGLGYMASMFHLFNHAFFKALLFLGAGAIIHSVHTNYMNEMGGLWKHLPITHITFLIACLAIAGIPPLSGFFSKDEILAAGLEKSTFLYLVMMIVSGLTAFYMFRLYFSIFWGKQTQYEHTPHEAPKTMTIPLLFLAVGALLTGLIPFSNFVTSDRLPFVAHLEIWVAIPAVLIALVGMVIATLFYRKENNLPEKVFLALGGFSKAAYHKFYIDELYLFITKKIIFNYISRPIAWFDRHIVDGTMNGISFVTNEISFRIRKFQSGQLQQYALVFVSGALFLALIFIYLWTN